MALPKSFTSTMKIVTANTDGSKPPDKKNPQSIVASLTQKHLKLCDCKHGHTNITAPIDSAYVRGLCFAEINLVNYLVRSLFDIGFDQA